MTDNNFDKWVHDKLHDHSSAVPGDMWNRIHAQKSAAPRFGWWWKAGGALLLIAITTGLVIFTKSTKNRQVIPANHSKHHIPVPQTNQRPNGKRNPSTAETTTANANGSATLKPVLNQAVEAPLAASKKTPGGLNNKVDNHSKVVQLTSLQKTNKPAYTSGIRLNGGKNRMLNAGNQEKAVDQLRSEKIALLRGEAVITDNRRDFKQANRTLPGSLKQFAIACSVDCPTSNRHRNHPMFLEVYGSPDYARKSVVAPNMTADYLARKDSSENFSYAFTAGFRLVKPFGKNMVLKTGLQYAQINEKFLFRRENERRQTTVITIRSIIRSPGDTLLVRDTSTVEQIGYLVTSSMNKYRSIDLPLIVGYEWGSDRLRVALNAGVLLNLSSWQTGQMLDTGYNAVPINKAPGGQVFKRNLGVGLYAGVSIMKGISNNLQIFAEPWFRYNFSQMTTAQNPFTQKFQVAGLSLGIRYRLPGSSRYFR
ncbi:hypothetical protein EXU57_06285 [Segetibacter sp. 3557_3]|uniref:outer membrane beta-barrel protein n=1 Tax=Segetibacter sp. 3557_3 TaxID=2547429 RepID=UPI0010587BF1|nr:outer membrane beta-barrel protein [Segetibacter sp. 3557_3]TDH28068.1 hypothetical protein EXU57_06285 [Segetibacter sp. 3557_3]